MSDQVQVPELENEDAILAYTHNLRKSIVTELMPQGKFPGDNSDRNAVITMLKDMDASAMGRKRIKVEEKANNNQEAASALIAKMLQMAGGQKPFQAEHPIKDITPPQLGSEVPEPELVEGETDTISAPENVDTFMKRMNQDLDIGDVDE
jgi:hypothetical protein